MFKWASAGTSGVEIIFIILLGCLFLSQTLGKVLMWLIGRFKYTAFNGRDIIEDLKKKNHLEKSKITVKKWDFRSSFYSYKKKSDEFIINHFVADHTNMVADAFSLQAVGYANERNHHTLQSRWQLIGVALLTIVPYLLFIGTMLLIYLPDHGTPTGNQVYTKLDLKYYLPTEIMCVIGWVVILISVFWWMQIVNNVENEMEDLAKQLDNRNIIDNLNSYMKLCSYIPFSFRTII